MQHGRQVTLLVTHDETCGPAAKVLGDQVRADLQRLQPPLDAVVRILPVGKEPCAHREAIYTALQQLYHTKHDDLHIVALLHNSNADEYRRVHEFCSSTKPQIRHLQVLTCLDEYVDAGLIIRNVARKVAAAAQS
jgi:hypothetical protein